MNFLEEFKQLLGYKPRIDGDYLSAVDSLLLYLKTKQVRPFKLRKREFVALLNKKFDFNSQGISDVLGLAARHGYTFNFHQKQSIQRAFDYRDKDLFIKVLKDRGIDNAVVSVLEKAFVPIDEAVSLRGVVEECKSPSKLRKDRGDRDIENEILCSLFSSFLWVSLPSKEMHKHFNSTLSNEIYQDSYWRQLQVQTPKLFNRENALHIVKITQKDLTEFTTEESLKTWMSSIVEKEFEVINNHGYFAVIIEPLEFNGRPYEWEVASDLMLIGEKFIEQKLEKNYFQWKRIEKVTREYIASIPTDIQFDLANEGFTYRDTFVIVSETGALDRLLLVFQKNQRDETPIPCPACRSLTVQGNSYPTLGVKSWECNNLLCPDRSKYNRGKRYSFKGLLMQEAIESEGNTIPVEKVRRWRRDIVKNVDEQELLAMLAQHYSMRGDTIRVNYETDQHTICGRTLKKLSIHNSTSETNFLAIGHIFKRYVQPSPRTPGNLHNLGDDMFAVYQGDAATLLCAFPEATFDGAVTSPPYFNAREYSQWANMYCYLHDMLEIGRQTYRTLKPGAIYLYNIFDYFDNENTTALSAMAQKRVILSAYTVDIFRRIGFELLGNIPWDKGDIEGKRGFNAGNFSPFYQAPFNCWEHILVFKKPGTTLGLETVEEEMRRKVREVFTCKPVLKMIRGENTYGHTAPYPSELPDILISHLPKNAVVLDPFAGSMTTGRIAETRGIRSVNLELSEEYCKLGLEKRNPIKQLMLLD